MGRQPVRSSFRDHRERVDLDERLCSGPAKPATCSTLRTVECGPPDVAGGLVSRGDVEHCLRVDGEFGDVALVRADVVQSAVVVVRSVCD